MKLLVLFVSVVLGQHVFNHGPSGDSVEPKAALESDSDLKDYIIGSSSLIDFHRKLVEIPSVSGNESAVAHYVSLFLESHGLTVELQSVEGNRYNVYAYDGQRDNKIVLTSHIDTVPPFLPYAVEGTKIYGRGSCDAKGSVASQVFSYLSLRKQGTIKPGDVALLFVVGEEVNGTGMLKTAELNTTWQIGIFGEPTELKLGVGHKGMLSTQIEVFGKNAHSGYPELGISATEIIIPALNELLNAEYPYHDLLGPTTLNVGMLNAGVAANVIPPHASARLAFRVATDLEKVKATVAAKLDGIDHLKYTFDFESTPQYLQYQVPGFESIVLAYSTDIPNLHQNLTKRFLYGPGTIHVAHSDHEYIESQDLVDAIGGYERLIKYNLA